MTGPVSRSLAEVERIRGRLWRTAPERRVGGERGALRFISELGFVVMIPIKGSELPSIHGAAGGDWGTWWDWKQTLPERKACYYAKLLRNRGMFVSWEWFPWFYATYADRRSYWRLYREGLLDPVQKRVLDLLDTNGPMMTRELRLAFGQASKQNTRRVKQSLVDLQRRFLVCPAGGDTEGWSHHRWDLVERWAPPEALAEARKLSPAAARTALVRKHVQNMVATTAADTAWLFGWDRRTVDEIVKGLIEAGEAEVASVPELEGEVVIPRPWPSRGSR